MRGFTYFWGGLALCCVTLFCSSSAFAQSQRDGLTVFRYDLFSTYNNPPENLLLDNIALFHGDLGSSETEYFAVTPNPATFEILWDARTETLAGVRITNYHAQLFNRAQEPITGPFDSIGLELDIDLRGRDTDIWFGGEPGEISIGINEEIPLGEAGLFTLIGDGDSRVHEVGVKLSQLGYSLGTGIFGNYPGAQNFDPFKLNEQGLLSPFFSAWLAVGNFGVFDMNGYLSYVDCYHTEVPEPSTLLLGSLGLLGLGARRRKSRLAEQAGSN